LYPELKWSVVSFDIMQIVNFSDVILD